MKKKNIFGNIVKTLILPMVVYLILFLGTGGRFGRTASMLLVVRQSVIPILMAMAVGFNMSMGMWDMSAGAVLYAAAILGGHFVGLTNAGFIGLLGICVAIAFVLATLSGILYKYMKIPSMVLTVGMVMLYEALPRVFGVTQARLAIKDAILAQAPWCFILLAIFSVLFHIVYNYTAFGHNARAIGADQKIARNTGINVEKTKLLSFMLGGVFLGVAATLYLSNNTTLRVVSSFGSTSVLFDAMMGVFIANFLKKYCNFTIGIIVGTLSMQMLTSGLVAMGMSTTTRSITQGLFLLLLLCFSSNQKRFDDYLGRRKLAKQAQAQYQKTVG